MTEETRILLVNNVKIEDYMVVSKNFYILEKEIERLNKECDTYMKIATQRGNIIEELEKWIDEYYKSNRKWYNTELSNHDKVYYEREYINTEAMLVKFDKKLKELKEGNK